MISPTTGSPRNSSRSLETRWCSAAYDECVTAISSVASASSRPIAWATARRPSEAAATCRSARLQSHLDVVDGVAHRLQVLEVLVVDPEPDRALAQLLFERLDQLDQREGVRVQVLGERRVLGHR